eukprot:TRINITY_DN7377_c0_g1_i1.p1 TRINITY_DN7377_c0_g1~~TRINITY_DN7377_c0_g1_i1.p1  ORF type:complete len:126 (-),score=19.67 TRINITY_DN7377_c0_g1_i1:86-463(-)
MFAGGVVGHASVGSDSLAQSFVPRTSTQLTSITLPINSSATQLLLAVSLDSTVLATSNVTLATATDGDVSFRFASAEVSLYSGDSGYSFALSCVSVGCDTRWRYNTVNVSGYEYGEAANLSLIHI